PPRSECPIRGFFVTPEAKKRAGPRRANGVHHWIERAQITRYIRRLDRRLSIARLRLDETHRVVTAGKIGTQRYGLLELSQRCRILATQPERPSHRPVRCRVTMSRQEAPAGCIEGAIRLTLPVGGLTVQSILPLDEGNPHISAGTHLI